MFSRKKRRGCVARISLVRLNWNVAKHFSIFYLNRFNRAREGGGIPVEIPTFENNDHGSFSFLFLIFTFGLFRHFWQNLIFLKGNVIASSSFWNIKILATFWLLSFLILDTFVKSSYVLTSPSSARWCSSWFLKRFFFVVSQWFHFEGEGGFFLESLDFFGGTAPL